LLPADWIGFGLYLAFFVVIGLPTILLKAIFPVPFEMTRKLYHLLITFSIFPLVTFFRTWYAAVLAALLFALILYPLLARVERTVFFQHIAVERAGGEFKRSLIIVQVSIALMIAIFWGLLGPEWKFVAIAAVMAWGFGDAAAALVGKRFGRRQFNHPSIDGKKTLEGTQAMYFTAGLAIFFTFLLYAGQPWTVSLAVALLAAPVSAAVELFSKGGIDTLTVPISTGLAVLTLLSLFSFLGA
jgi:dolichol kinase